LPQPVYIGQIEGIALKNSAICDKSLANRQQVEWDVSRKQEGGR